MTKISTDNCKDHLVAFFNEQGTETKASQWKRGSKRKEGDDVVRDFSHPTLGGFILVERDGTLLKPEKMDDVKEQAVLAKAILSKLMGEEYEGPDLIKKSLIKGVLRPESMASQFVFGVAGPTSMVKNHLIAIITPKAFWEKEGYCFDQELPLESLLPKGSDDLNGCGTWCIPFQSMDPVEFKAMLKGMGFVWDQKFQTSVNGMCNNDVNDWDPSVLDEAPSKSIRQKP